MLEAFLCLVGVALVWAIIGAIQSRVSREGESIVSFYAAGFSLSGALAWVLFPSWSEGAVRGTPVFAGVVLWIGLSGIANGAGKAMMIAAMRRGHKAVTLAMGQSTMLVPFLAGVVLWGERPGALTWTGIALALVGLATLAMYRGGNRCLEVNTAGGWLALALGAFVIMGLGRTCFLVPSQGTKDAVELTTRTPVALTSAAIVHVTLMLVRRTGYDRRLLPLSVAFALLAICGYELMFRATDLLQERGLSGLAFPVSVSICIVAFGMYSRLRLKEPFNRRTVAGMALTAAGLLLMVA